MRPRVLYQTAVNSTSGKDPSPSYTQTGKENDLANAPNGIDYSCDGIRLKLIHIDFVSHTVVKSSILKISMPKTTCFTFVPAISHTDDSNISHK